MRNVLTFFTVGLFLTDSQRVEGRVGRAVLGPPALDAVGLTPFDPPYVLPHEGGGRISLAVSLRFVDIARGASSLQHLESKAVFGLVEMRRQA